MRRILDRSRITIVAAFVVFATLAMANDRRSSPRAEFVGIRFNQASSPQYLVFEMKNAGDRAVFPLITYLMRDATGKTIASGLNFKAMVILPGKTLDQIVPVGMLSAGDYEVHAEVNFQDGHATQTLRRPFRVEPGVPYWTD